MKIPQDAVKEIVPKIPFHTTIPPPNVSRKSIAVLDSGFQILVLEFGFMVMVNR